MKHVKTFENFLNEGTNWKIQKVKGKELKPGDYIASGPTADEISEIVSIDKNKMVLNRVWSDKKDIKVGEEFDHIVDDMNDDMFKVTNFEK
jgi:intein/homing endonuclease